MNNFSISRFKVAIGNKFSVNLTRQGVRLVVLCLAVLGAAFTSQATVTITKATGGANICTNKAANGSAPAAVSIGTITVTEGAKGDFGGNTSGTWGTTNITLAPPTGWVFVTSVTPTCAKVSGTNLSTVTRTSFTSTALTVTLTGSGKNQTDKFQITGLSVQASSSAPSTFSANGNITASAVNNIKGVTVNSTSFAALSQSPQTVSGTASVCAGSTVTLTDATAGGTWSSGATGIATVVSSTGVVTGVSAGNANITYTSSGCTTYLVVTVNATPTSVTVAGTTPACGSTTLTASGGTGGTIYYEGTTSNGTSTATASTSQTVSSSGTYYFRAQSTGGCWSTQGSLAVTVNANPATISGNTHVCSGSILSISDATTGGTWISSNTGVATAGSTGTGNTANVGGVAAGTVTITYTIAATGCYATVADTVIGAPGTITGVTPICPMQIATFTDAAAYGTWSSANTGVASVNPLSGSVTGVAGGTATISYTTGCGTAASKNVTVTTAAISGGTTPLCAGTNTSLTGLPVGGTWASSSTGIATIGSSTGMMGGVVSGTSLITYNTGVCSVAQTASVTAAPAGISGTTHICAGFTTQLSNTVPFGTWSSSNTAKATVDATGLVSGVAAGTCTISYATGCGSAATVTVTVNALPSAISGSLSVCSGSAVTLTDATAGGTWSSSAGSVATVVSGTGVVTGVAAGTTNITYTITASGCYANSILTVNQAPALIGGGLSVCAGAVTTLTDATASGTWSSSAASVATANSVTGDISGVAAGTTTISYSLPDGCVATSVFTVNPVPAAVTVSGGGTFCDSVILTASGGSGGTIYLQGNVSGGTDITYPQAVDTEYSSDTYYFRAMSSAGCWGAEDSATVTINDTPSPISGAGILCAGSNTTLTDATASGAWTSSNTSVATIGSAAGDLGGVLQGTSTISYTLTGCSAVTVVTVYASPSAIGGNAPLCASGSTITLTNTSTGGSWSGGVAGIATVGSATGVVTPGASQGTAAITYSNGCGSNATVTVSVNANPASINGTGVVCAGSATTLSNTSTGGTWSSSTTSVATVGSLTGVVSGVSQGTATITYSNGCGLATTTVVTVNASPAAITGTMKVCAGAATALTNTSANGTWSSSATGVATVVGTSGLVSGVSQGTATITYSNGCGGAATAVITVNAVPAVMGGPAMICTGSATTLTNTSTGGAWTTSDATIATVNSANGLVTGVAQGTATIFYANGCGSAATKVVTVNAVPAAITGTMNICAGATSTLANTSANGTWSSSATGVATVVSTSGLVTGVAQGTTTITYSNGCGTAATAVVTVNAAPAAITGTMNICIGATSTLANTSANGTWSSSSTSIATVVSTSGLVTGVSQGTATITYSNGCGTVATAVVTVNAAPAAISGTMNICAGATTTLANTSANGTWSSSATGVATVVSTSGLVTGVAQGTTTITYSNGCGTAATAVVTVNAAPAAISGTMNICAGATTTLANTSANGTWSSSATGVATVVSTSGLVTGVAQGTATITYSNGCGSAATKVVTVNAAPAAITGAMNICAGATTTLANTSANGTWSSSATGVATVVGTSGLVTGVAQGTTTITYSNGCGTVATAVVTVNAAPAAITGTMNICAGATSTLANTSANGTWSSSTMGVATVVGTSGLVTGVSQGTATITYSNSCGSAATAVVTVNAAPAAITGTMNICAGATTTLANTSANGTWSSSVTGVATVVSTSGLVTGVAQGTTTITYSNGCGTDATVIVTVNAIPTAAPSNDGPICVGGTVNFSANSTGATAWLWTGPSGFTSASASPSASPLATGTYSLTVSATGAGCAPATVYTTSVTVNVAPTAAPANSGSVCIGSAVVFTANPSTSVTSYSWSGPSGFSSTLANPAATPTVTGTYSLTVGGPSGSGCSSTAVYTTTVTVNALPSSISGMTTVCAGSASALSDAGGGTWSCSNTAVATVGATTGVLGGVTAGTASVTYTLSTGCSATTSVNVLSSPMAIGGSSVVCVGVSCQLTDAGGGTWSSSNVSVATIDAATGLVRGVAAGTAIITYTLPCGIATMTMSVVAAASLPVITSVTPASGQPGLPVTITGYGFNSATTANIVYFGATRATVTAASSTSLTAQVPCGATYAPVSVENAGCALTGYAQYPFTPVYVNLGGFSGSGTSLAFNFDPAVPFNSGTNPYHIAIGDIDGDGKADVAVTNVSSNTVSVYRNTSVIHSVTSGSFAAKVDFATGSQPYGVAIGDLDGDGKPDLIVANEASNTVSILHNTSAAGTISAGSFAAKVDFATGTNPISIAIGDVDMDGKPDVVVANFFSNTISVLRNTTSFGTISTGSLASKVDFTAGSHPYSIALGDIDGDQKPEIVVANQGANTVSILRNTSTAGSVTTGSFASKVDFTTGTQPVNVALGDIDGDGKLDIAIANAVSRTISVFRNTASSGAISTSSLASRVDFTAGVMPFSIAIADIDGDRKADMIVSHEGNTRSGTTAISIFLNQATSGSVSGSSFAAKTDIVTASSPRFLAVGDLDGDTRPDIAYTLISDNTFNVFRYNSIQPITGTPSICGVGNTTSLGDTTASGTWSSSNTSVATVAGGTVTAVSAGTTTITYSLSADYVTITVTVTPGPTAISGATSVCIGATATLTDGTSGGAWSSAAASVANIGSSTGIVSGLSSGTSVITYSVGTNCYATAVVTVNPAAISGASALCVGLTATLTDAGGGAWSSSNTGVASIDAAAGVVTAVSAGTTTISYSVSGCVATSTFTVQAAPSAITGTNVTCAGATTSLTDGGSGTWMSSNTAVATVGPSTGIVYGVSSGTSVISYSLGSGCASTATVTVNAMPAAISGPASLCPTLTVTLSDGTAGGAWSSSNTGVVTVGSSSGTAAGVAAGTVTITYATSGSGCIATSVVTVNTAPAAITGTAYVCAGSTTTLSSSTAGGTWSSGSATVATVSGSGIVTGVSAGTSIITYTTGSGCIAIATVTVNTMPAAITGPMNVCIGSSTALIDSGGGDWTSSNTAVALIGSTTGLVTGASLGTATITYTYSTGCLVTTNVTVNALPSSISGVAVVCAGSVTSLTDAGSGTWSSADSTIATVSSATGTVTGVASGTVNITYTNGSGCAATANVTVNPSPGSITGSTSICIASSSALGNSLPGGSWSSGDAGIASIGSATGTITGVSAGTVTITYSLPTGCMATAVVTVNALPSAISGATNICAGSNTSLTDAGGGTWSSSDATIATVSNSAGVVGGVAAGSAYITYTLGTGCLATSPITVNPLPAGITGAGNVCVGSAITYADATTGGAWSSASTAIATVAPATGFVGGVAAGTTTITYTSGAGCVATANVTVNPLPSAITGTAVVCEGATTSLTDAGAGAWSSANTTTATVSATGTVAGVTYGVTTISYTLGTGCVSTITVTVNQSPSGISGSTSLCSGSTMSLTDAVSGGTWASNNTAAATIGSSSAVVTGVSAGTTVITYALPTGCAAVAAISVNSLPTVITGSTYVCSGLTTALADSIAGGVWSSSNIAVATVSSSGGVVTGVSSGTAVITYALPCGSVTAIVTVGGVAAGPVTITSVSPVAGYPGSSVTISGTNFNTVTTNNTVFFGATQAVVTAASATSLSVTVPADATYAPVSVNNNGCNLTGYAAYPYMPGYNNSAYIAGTINFASKADFVSGANPYSVAIGDLDGDGKADLVTANLGSNTVSVFRNTSTSGSVSAGSFAAKVDFTTGNSPYSVIVGDVDGDGKLDIIAGNEASNTVSILRNMATSGSITSSSFAAKVDFATGTNPISVALGDIDADGKPDLVVANFYSNTISVLRNTATFGITSSSFAARVDFATGTHPYSVATGDIDGDGKADVVVANQGSSTVSVFRNTAGSGSITTGALAAKVDFTAGTNPYYVALGDIDGDNKLDVVVVNNGSNTMSVLRNTATSGSITSGSLAAKVDFTTGAAPYNVSMGDIDGDGKVDLAVANSTSNTVSVFRNTSSAGSVTTGSLANKVDFATGASPRFVAVGDLDGDGKADLAVANLASNTVSVIRNNPLGPNTGTTSLCIGSASTLGNSAAGGTWTSGNTSVATVVSSTGVVTGVASGTAVISYTMPGGTVTSTVTVSPAPAAISGAAAVCAASSVVLTDGTGGGTWSSSNTSVATIVAATGALSGVSAGTVTITYATGVSCFVVRTETVNTLPTSITGSPSVCTASATTLSNSITGGTWSSSATSVATIGSSSGSLNGVSAGTVTITYTTGAGCYTTTTETVISSPASISGTTGLCAGSSTTLTDGTGGGTWSSSNTSVATVVSGTGVLGGVATGTSVITYTATSGCIAIATVTVNSVPASISGSLSVCAGSTVALSDATGGGVWTSSAASVATIGSTGVVSGITAGTTIITYTVGAACATTSTVTVNGVPAISSLSASSGFPGSSVTITGANFNATAANNAVYFGATKAVVSAASGSSLTVSVPTGATYMPVSVDNTGCHLTAYSQYPYLPTWDNSAYVSGSIVFASKVDFNTSSSPYSVAIGDFDGDGLPDMVAANQASNTVSVFRNTSTGDTITSGSFAAKVDFATGTSPYGVAVADLDGDGKLDIAVANNSSNTISVLRNTATIGSITVGSFATKVDFATGTNPMNVAIGDLDGDGKPELIASNFYSNTISVLHNTSVSGAISTNSFAAKVDFATGTHPYCVAIGDIDGDGRKDIVCANQAASSISVFRNTVASGVINSGSFAAKVDFTTGSNPYSVAIGDIDGDGKMDIVVANNGSATAPGSATVSVFRNTAASGSITSGSLAAKVDFATGSSPYFVALGDIDGDGKLDIIVPNSGANTVSVFRNTASSGTINSSSLATKIDFITGGVPRCVAVGDLDGDGKPDIAVANFTSNSVSVLKNTPAHLAPHMPASSAVTLCVGAMVALNYGEAGGEWNTTNSGVATVDGSTGIVTAISAGRAAIVYTTANATYVTNITVNPLPDAVVVKAYPGTNIQPGQNVTLTAAVQNGGTAPVYQWQINGNAIPGATDAAYISSSYSNNDVVTCVVGSSAGCNGYSISGSVTINVSNNEDNQVLTGGADIRIVPNPNNGAFTIKGSIGSVTDAEVTAEVVNVLGQVVYTSRIVAKDGRLSDPVVLAGNLANGMYVLSLHIGKETKAFHVMIER